MMTDQQITEIEYLLEGKGMSDRKAAEGYAPALLAEVRELKALVPAPEDLRALANSAQDVMSIKLREMAARIETRGVTPAPDAAPPPR
jgi:hypothetical protein